jgi:tetratricopeptide (TPR) repeat protein
MRIVRLFAAARWKEAEEKFVKEAPELPDADLLTCFQQAQLGVVKAKQLEMWDRLCAWIVKEQKAKPRVWQAAAYSWLENVRAMNKAATEFPARLEIVQRLEGDPNVMLALYYIYSDPVMKDNNSANLQTMIKIGEKLSDKFKAPQEKELCACKIAEYHFLLQDYDAALRPFKKPLVAMEPKEQETVVNKIKAHQADKKGDYQEAIKYFRAFMENVKQWTSPEVSPFLDITFSKEMALGLSAKRIGDCYQKMKDSAKAQAAYQEADGYYVIAEKEFKDKKAESEYVKKCRAELAALLKK